MIPNKEQINKWINDIHSMNIRRDWSDSAHLLQIAGEIAEAMEADRKGQKADLPFFLSVQKAAKSMNAEVRYFTPYFESAIKDTIEDKLADIIIRCCDYLGCHGLEFKLGYDPIWQSPFWEIFAEKAWQWVTILSNPEHKTEDKICHLIYEVLDYCDIRCIDIEKHIELKLKYNGLRPYRHGGKAY